MTRAFELQLGKKLGDGRETIFTGQQNLVNLPALAFLLLFL
jgi:hypothetical protein